MTAQSFVEAASEGETLHCYRHPDRETYVRCGRCDQPICPRCAMQGPVGFRCKTCGKPSYDPLTSLTPLQFVLGTGVSLAAGTIGGVIGLRLGFFVICIGFFAGGLIADAVMRVTGYKRGPLMATILLGGIAAGTVLAALLDYSMLAAGSSGSAIDGSSFPLVSYLYGQLVWGAIFVAAAMAGAWGRFRF